MGSYASNIVSNEDIVPSVVPTDTQQPRTPAGKKDFKRYFMAILGGKASKKRKSKASYKNKIAYSGFDRNMPIHKLIKCP